MFALVVRRQRKHLLHIDAVEADAVVAHRDFHQALRDERSGNDDAPQSWIDALGCVNAVDDEVQEYLLQLDAITDDAGSSDAEEVVRTTRRSCSRFGQHATS